MRVEIQNAANFLANLLRVKSPEIANVGQLERFARRLEEAMGTHYQQHWFPATPCKGSGYRCIRINHKMDPILARAGSEVGLDEAALRQLFPSELTLWVDPREVSYRIGENGSICVLYDGSHAVSRRLFDVSSSDEEVCSPMSMSPPSPLPFDNVSCKNSLRGPSWDSFVMDSHNVSFELSSYAG